MLGKLLKYDLASIGRVAGLLQLIAVGAAFLGAFCGFVGYWMNEFDPAAYTEVLQMLAALGVVAGFIVLICLVPATFVVVLHRFYTNFFTDQGYLTFTLPVKASELFWSKIIAGIVWLFIAVVVASVGAILVGLGAQGLNEGFAITDTVPYWIMNVYTMGVVSGVNETLAMCFSMIGVALSLTSVLLLAYMSFTLGALWARQHKLLVGIALFAGIGFAINMISGTVDVLIGFNGLFDWSSYKEASLIHLTIIYILHDVRDAVLIVVYFFITLFCLKRHVNLA